MVPTSKDVEHAQRELAERGAIFGAQVVAFDWLLRADRPPGRAVGRGRRREVQCELIAEEAVRRSDLDVLAASAAQPGFARAALRFATELERSMVEPARFTEAMRALGRRRPAPRLRRRGGDGLPPLPRGPRRSGPGRRGPVRLARAERAAREPPALARDAGVRLRLRRLRPPPARRAGDPVGRCGADVVVSLPFEPGREAFKAVAESHGRLVELADEEVELEPLDDHYSPGARPALHHLERGLFATEQPERVDPGEAVRLHSAGGERAEVELVGAEVLGLLREGTRPGDVAVVFRDPGHYASLVEQVFEAYDIPFSIDRARAAAPDRGGPGPAGPAALRAAGGLGRRPAELAAHAGQAARAPPGRRPRGRGAPERRRHAPRPRARCGRTSAGRWTRSTAWPAPRSPARCSTRSTRSSGGLFAAPHKRQAPLLTGPELDDARAYRAGHKALRELRAVVAADPKVSLSARRIHDRLAELPVSTGEDPAPDRVQVTRPEDARARRFEAVFVCGLQEGEFPQAGSPEPFLPDEDRRGAGQGQRPAAAAARGPAAARALPVLRLRLARRAAAGAQLALLRRGGRPAGALVLRRRRRRAVHRAARAPALAVRGHLGARRGADGRGARALAGRPRRRGSRTAEAPALTADALLELLSSRGPLSASALERYADCPVKWLVDSLLNPEALEPDPEQMVRGAYAHRVLEQHLRHAWPRRPGSKRVTPETLPAAERILLAKLDEHRGEFRLSPNQTRVRAAVRKLEFDLLRFLRWEAESDSRFEPEYLEHRVRLGRPGRGGRGASRCAARSTAWTCGTATRWSATTRPPSGPTPTRWPAGSARTASRPRSTCWPREQTLGLEPVGGVYEPLGSNQRAPRGLLSADVDEVGSVYKRQRPPGPGGVRGGAGRRRASASWRRRVS